MIKLVFQIHNPKGLKPHFFSQQDDRRPKGIPMMQNSNYFYGHLNVWLRLYGGDTKFL